MPHAIPYSIYLGRPLPAPGEPMWLPSDTAWVAEWQRYEATLCKKCRTRDQDWRDEHGNILTAMSARQPTYEFQTRRCFGCQDYLTQWEVVRKVAGEDTAQLYGLEPVLVPYGTAKRRQQALDDEDDWDDED